MCECCSIHGEGNTMPPLSLGAGDSGYRSYWVGWGHGGQSSGMFCPGFIFLSADGAEFTLEIWKLIHQPLAVSLHCVTVQVI